MTRFLALSLCLTLGMCATYDTPRPVDPAAMGMPAAVFGWAF